VKYFKSLFLLILLIFLSFPAYSLADATGRSGVTAQDIIDRVRIDLNDTSSSTFSDAALIYWIDEAVWEIVNRTQCLETGVSNIIVQADTRSYPIIDTSGVSYMTVIKVEYDIGLSGATLDQTQVYDLDRAPFKNLRYGREKEFGNPKIFAINNDTLYIWPIPRSDQSGNTLYLYRSLMPNGVTSSTSPIETPAYFDPAIWHYVRAQAMYRERRENRGAFYMALFEAMVGRNEKLILQRDAIIEK